MKNINTTQIVVKLLLPTAKVSTTLSLSSRGSILSKTLTAKRFRDFLNLPPHLDLKANDDTVDIVGFLAFEMVRSLTLAGLTVKKSLEESYLREEYSSPALGKRKHNGLGGSAEKRRRESSPDDDTEYTMPVNALFMQPPEDRKALMPEHLQDAFSRMQGDWSHKRSAGMHTWRGGLVRTRVSLI